MIEKFAALDFYPSTSSPYGSGCSIRLLDEKGLFIHGGDFEKYLPKDVIAEALDHARSLCALLGPYASKLGKR